MRREEVKQKLGSVCDVCVYWFDCDEAIERCEVGCERFELNTFVLCNVDCKECYMFKLEICEGVESKYVVTIDL
ncbi:MAG: hypothetical protein QW540_07365 [Archaeoglobaceae archaeon]